MSKGEDKIAALLKAGGIKFKREVSFPDLKNYGGHLMRFDFAIYNDKGQLTALIEYDGEQHFQQVKKFQKTIFEFRQTQERDRRKNSYCLTRKIPLIRVPYWDYENLTLLRLLTNPEYRVVSKFHSDLLKRR